MPRAGVEADVPLRDDGDAREADRRAGQSAWLPSFLRADGPEREQQRGEARRLGSDRVAGERRARPARRRRSAGAANGKRCRAAAAAASRGARPSEHELRPRHRGDPDLDLGDDREPTTSASNTSEAPACRGVRRRQAATRARRSCAGAVEREPGAHEEAALRSAARPRARRRRARRARACRRGRALSRRSASRRRRSRSRARARRVRSGPSRGPRRPACSSAFVSASCTIR